jgi:hypothetical protein
MSPTIPVRIPPNTERFFFFRIGADAQDVPVEVSTCISTAHSKLLGGFRIFAPVVP